MYILPEPSRVISAEDKQFTIRYTGRIILCGIREECELISAKTLQEELAGTLGFVWDITRGMEQDGCIMLIGTNEMQAEEYQINIDSDKIVIRGQKTGIWYGVQTLRQLIRTEGAVLPGLFIEDAPGMANRGFYHDISRGRIPTLNEMKRTADHLAFYKMNQLQMYVEHSFLFQGFSEVWRDDTPLTPQDILELDEYCRERHIELVPSLSSFGHLYKVLRSKKYKSLCEVTDSGHGEFSFVHRMSHHTLDVTNEQSFELVKKMIEEYLPLFTSKYFNVCADETFDLGKGRSREEAERNGIRELYMGFLKKICNLVAAHGRIPMFWGDIICKFEDAVSELPEGTICLNWGYAADQSDEETKLLKTAGAVQYVCPGVSGWNNFVNNMKVSYENISRMCSYGFRHDAVGVLNTDWGDFGHINHPEFSSVGMIYGAAFSWNKIVLERKIINEKISVLEYCDRTGKLVDILSELSELSVYSWFYAVIWMEQRKGKISSDHSWFSLNHMDWEKLYGAEDKLSRLEQELYKAVQFIEKEGRQKLAAYLLAADGIHIWNQIGKAVKEFIDNGRTEAAETRNYYELAERLESWYHRYKELWRLVSRESEMYRISEVVFWYADFLREQ